MALILPFIGPWLALPTVVLGGLLTAVSAIPGWAALASIATAIIGLGLL